jgi:hypothetical protein
MRTEADLRAACEELAAQAPSVDHVLQQLNTPGGWHGSDLRVSRRRRVLLPLMAVAAVIAIVAITVVFLQAGTSRNNLPSGPSQQITCVPSAGEKPSAGQLFADRQTILDRLTRLGVRHGQVVVDGGKLVITAPTARSAITAELCAQHPVEVRPLIAAPVAISGPASSSTDPLAALPFTPPTSEAGYQRLSPSQRQLVTAALTHAPCSSPGTATRTTDRIICDSTTNPTVAVLLGPSLIDDSQIAAATAMQPDAGSGQSEWTVHITLNPTGQSALSTYIATHNSGGAGVSPGPVSVCGPTATPCADFIAFTAYGALASPLVNLGTVTGDTLVITGNFTHDTATAFAAQISSGTLAVPLRAVSNPTPTSSSAPTGTHS